MSRKRLAPVRLLNNGIPTPHVQAYQYEYYRPGCYYIPQIEHQVTPFVNTYMNHWLPYCRTATYVIDRYGRANYLSDFEYQLQVPVPHLPQQQPQEIIYHFYNDGEVELSSLPQIEEEDFDDSQEVCVRRKRKRLNSSDRSENMAKKVSKNQGDDFHNNQNTVYRSKEGYLVEEPNDGVSDDA